jgi:ligand-binding sensor domain-containing protein
MKKTCVILLLTWYTCICSQAQSSDFPYSLEKLSVEQGLSNSSVYCLLQDQQGFIWAGAQSGLNRYDGYSFVRFDREPGNPASLRDNFINCLLEDRDGSIWAGA